MRLLITTQAVDLDDPVLGFFHRWIEEFAKRHESIHVICLKEGRHDLPENVFVHSLGKESGASRIKYIWNFYRYIWKLRNNYDAVFVHMNQEYVLLGWKLWWLSGKRIILWRNHKKGSLSTRIAALVSHKVCYTSPEAYVAKYKNAVKMPIGIDTAVFKPGIEPLEKGSILFLGRLDPVKKAEVFVDALKKLAEENVEFHADIYGDPTEPFSPYAVQLKKQGEPLVARGILAFHPGVTNAEAAALYRTHAIYVNLTPSGSFDKTIGEAMASGCVVVAANEILRGVIPDDCVVSPDDTASVARGVRFSLALADDARGKIAEKSRAWVVREHSLTLLSDRLEELLS